MTDGSSGDGARRNVPGRSRSRVPRESGDERLAATQALSGFLAPERSRLFDGGGPEKQAQLLAAERVREVYGAWNAVCAGTREGVHVTGLHYVPERNELVVYADGAAWAQELTMLREIIRARMAARGAEVDAIAVRTSREGYGSPAAIQGKGSGTGRANALRPTQPGAGTRGGRASHPAISAAAPAPRPPREALTPLERERLEREVAPIQDDALRQALEKAMKASFEWKKGMKAQKRP